nr:ATP-binding protein [Sinorhizobium meliloti]
MKAARFPAYKDISGYDFAASEINEATVRQLHRCEFIDGAQNMVLVGGPGTGKTHVATARVFRRLSIIAGRSASSRPSNWSMRSSRKRPKAKQARLPRRWFASIC